MNSHVRWYWCYGAGITKESYPQANLGKSRWILYGPILSNYTTFEITLDYLLKVSNTLQKKSTGGCLCEMAARIEGRRLTYLTQL
ncbi:hypothetical protein AVEN_137540-1 [Araneus ventricosus]|uniref:Uncharacterized protein n=1 Tax=Araneus ventricosus TaxID=182803 RepID=A0A4Y2FNB2_ARAVE|nr:hypothetical protein AVEN_137540-1 [Araneus ventricosus]